MATWRTAFSKIILSYQGRIGKDPREIIYPVTSPLTVKHKSLVNTNNILYLYSTLSSQSAFKDIIPINPCKEIDVLFWGRKKLWAQKWSVPLDLQNFSDLMIDVWNVLIKDCSIKIHIHSWNEYIHRESHWELMGTLPFWSCNSSVLIWTVSFSPPPQMIARTDTKVSSDSYPSGEERESREWLLRGADFSGTGVGAGCLRVLGRALPLHMPCGQCLRGAGLIWGYRHRGPERWLWEEEG